MPPINPDDYLTPRQVREALGVSKRTVTYWLASGLPHLKFGPRAVLIRRSAAEAWSKRPDRTSARYAKS